MLQLKTHQFDLPLRHAFTISRGTTTEQPTLIVELTDGVHRGFGEATASNYYGATIADMRAALDAVRPQVESLDAFEPAALWQQLSPAFGGNSFAQCALDVAAWDLWGKRQGAPLYKLWGHSTERTPMSDFTIGIDSIDAMVKKLIEMHGWPIYKIKLGMRHDLDVVRELRKYTGATFRVDVNGGWKADETIFNSYELAKLGVEFIEQPLRADDWDGARRVFERSALPIIADESCITEGDVPRCVDHFHGVNIKLMKCGGLTPARRMIAQARELGLKTMVGCMTESTVGISAIAHLLPVLDYVDMDGAALLAADVAAGVTVDRGRAIFPDANGTGARLND